MGFLVSITAIGGSLADITSPWTLDIDNNSYLGGFTGRIPAATSKPFAFTANSEGLTADSYVTLWDFTTEETDPWSLPDLAFCTTTLNADQPEFVPDRETITISPASNSAGNISPLLLTSRPGFDLAGVTVSSNKPWLTAINSENRPGQINLHYNAIGLFGTQEAILTLTGADTVIRVPVVMTLRSLNITRLIPDLWRHRVYGIDESRGDEDSLLIIDGENARVLRSLPVGRYASDIATSPDGQYLYILSSDKGEIRRIHLDTMREVDRRTLAEWTPALSNLTEVHLVAAPDGRLYVQTADDFPEVLVFDYPSGTILQSTKPESEFGIGSFAFNDDYSRLIVSSGFSYGSSSSGHLYSYPVTANGTLGPPADVNPANFERLNFIFPDARIFPSPGNGPIYYGNFTLDRASLMRTSRSLDTNVLAISSNGRVIFNRTGIIRADDGSTLQAAKNVFFSVQAITADQRRLIAFDYSSEELTAVDLSSHAALLGQTVSPNSDGSTPFSGSLQWPAITNASEYHLYLADSAAALAPSDATGTPRVPASHLRIAAQSKNTWKPTSPLPLGSTWFWRVDALTTDGTRIGSIHSFQIPDALPTVGKLRFDAVRGLSSQETSVSLELIPGLGSWSASTDAPWLQAEAQGSTSLANLLKVRVLPASLAPGFHHGVVTVTANGRPAHVAVTLCVHSPRFTQVKADPILPRIYAVHEDTPYDQLFGAQLLVIDSHTGAVVSQTSIGRSVTSFAVHVADNRLYLTNWRAGGVIALDRDTLAEVRRYPFPPFTGAGYSDADSYHVAAGVAGRIVVEGGNQTVEMRLLDTQSGTILSNVSVSAGGGAFSPDGRSYYHGDRDSSYEITRFGLESGQFRPLLTLRPSSDRPYPVTDRSLLVSRDGQRVFWAGIAFDSQLIEISRFGEPVRECSGNGNFVVTPTRVAATFGSRTLLTLPFFAQHAALSPASSKLFIFRSEPDETQSAFEIIDLTSTLSVPDSASTIAQPENTSAVSTIHPPIDRPVSITSHGLANGKYYLEFQNSSADPETIVVETSDDLIRWRPLHGVQPGIVSRGVGMETHRVEMQPDGPCRFYRLRREKITPP